MSDDEVERVLQSLLEGKAEVSSRVIFELTLTAARQSDPTLAEVLPLCALAPMLDPGVIGVLRREPEDLATNLQIFTTIADYIFVRKYEDGSCVFPESLRNSLISELERTDFRRISELKRELLNFFHNQGQRYFDLGAYSQALAILNRGIQVASADSPYYVLRGRVAMSLGDLGLAHSDFTDAISRSTDNPEPYFRRATVLMEQQQYEEALADLNQAIDLDASVETYFYARATAWYRLGSPELAVADYDQAIKLMPTRGEFYQGRAIALYQQDLLPQAYNDLSKAMTLEPSNASHFLWRGITNFRLKSFDEALRDFSQAIILGDESDRSYRWRGAVHSQRNDYVQALADFARAIQLAPTIAINYAWSGWTRYYLHEYRRAVTDLDQAIKLDPQVHTFYLWRGAIRSGLGLHQQALDDFTRALKLAEYADTYRQRGVNIYLNVHHNLDAALQDLTRAVELNPKYYQGYFWRGHIYLELGEHKRAFDDLDAAVSKEPRRARNRFWRGIAADLLERAGDAIDDWRTSEQLDENSEAHQLVRQAWPAALMGNIALARQRFQQALETRYRLDELRDHRTFLARLARLYPHREDLAELASWFEANAQEHLVALARL